MTATIKPLSGGLQTKDPPTSLPPDASPDLLNVVVSGGAVERRGGFPLEFLDRMKLNAVRSEGLAARARGTFVAGAADVDYRTVAASMVAGHRHAYEALAALSFDLFFEVGDLTAQQGGDAGGPYDVKIRPILSKGPVKRTKDTSTSLFAQAQIGWVSSASVAWGNHSNSGLQFCLYLWNNGTGTAPSWQFRLAAHVLVAGSWTLQTVTSGVIPKVGGQYHIIGACSGSRVALRIAQLFPGEAPVYTANETVFTGTLAWNRCPIQVFDCPQQLVDATAVGSATQRPGLALAGLYWNQCLRAEGRVEDLVIWSTDRFASTATALDRQAKLDLAQAVGVLGYWSMASGGSDLVQEVSGRGNHLYLMPRGPVSDAVSGGQDGSSWFFNGQTSYALIDVNSASWREDGSDDAVMNDAIKANKPHGMHVQFWVDAIEPQFEQVVAEIHGGLRLVITTDGNIRAYARSGGGGAGTAQNNGENYQTGVTSSFVVTPGERYSVAVLRETNGTLLNLYINGQLDATAGVTASDTVNAHAVGGVTIGMGAYETLIRAAAPAGPYQPVNDINTDPRSGFVGRVESFKVLLSRLSLASPTYKPESVDDWRVPESLAWIVPTATTTLIEDCSDPARQDATGAVMLLEGHIVNDQPLAYLVLDSTTLVDTYGLGRATITDADSATGRYGNSVDVTGMGARAYHALCFYRFNVDDRDNLSPGNYVRGMELRYNSAATTATQNTSKYVHVQFSAIADSVGILGAAQRRCVENDVQDDRGANIFVVVPLAARLRPYSTRSPREIGAKWGRGIAAPLPGQARVTLLHEWVAQSSARRFLMTGCGRQLYWARDIWERGGPFGAQDWVLSCPGEPGSHVVFRSSNAGLAYTGTATKTTVVFECWLKPERLDGRRIIAAKVTPTSSLAQVNWFISTQDGSIEVQGTLGAGTRTWGWSEGTGSGTAILRRSQSLRAGTWNHLHVTMETSGVTVRVNGNLVPMLSMAALTGGGDRRDAHTAAAGDDPAGELYLCGLPKGRDTLSLAVTVSASTVTLATQPWSGAISDVRVSSAIDSANWPTGLDGFAPRARLTDAAGTVALLACGEGRKWRLASTAAATVADVADVAFAEFITIAEGLQADPDSVWRATVWRDTMIVTNGVDRPQRITFRGFPSQRPFTVRNLGVLPPTVVVTRNAGVAGAAGAAIPIGTYLISMSFLTEDGLESEPIQIATYSLVAAAVSLTVRLDWIPRSDDPQVVGRRIYASAPGGGDPIFNRDIGNDGYAHDVWIHAPADQTPAEAGNRIVAPRAKHVGVAGSSLLLAHLTEVAAGQNGISFSSSGEPSYFPLGTDVLIDSQEGLPIIGVAGLGGQLFVSKRDSIYQIGLGAIADQDNIQAAIRLLFAGDGVGAGSVTAGGIVFGAGDRGVFMFDGAAPTYQSRDIEPTWAALDLTDEGLAAQRGVGFKLQSEYWLSVRRTGQQTNDRILVLYLIGQNAWTLFAVPAHVTMASRQGRDQRQAVVLGTDSGSILRYDPTEDVDAVDSQAGKTITGSTGLSGSATSLTMSGATFDTRGGGLAGATVEIVHAGGTVTRQIASNDATTIRWVEPIAGWTSHTSFTIGGFDSYWSSPWMSQVAPGSEQKIRRVDLEMVPQATTLQLRVASIRQQESPQRSFPAAHEVFDVSSANGWLQIPPLIKAHAQGHQHRIKVGASGVLKPWGLIGYGLELVPLQALGHAGRTT